MYLIISTTLVCTLFVTSPINFIQLFLLLHVLLLLPLGKHMHRLWATPTLGSTLASVHSFMPFFSNKI